MERGALSLEVRVHGRPVREYQSENGETWIEGRKGSDFILRVSNRTPIRQLAVVTVDGLSVINGEEGSYDSGGYVLDAFGHVDIPGWRLDKDNVAAFRFHKPEKSYAEKTGKPLNIGVIGCAFFREAPTFTLSYTSHAPNWHDRILRGYSPSFSISHCADARPKGLTAQNCGGQVYAASLGTQFGERKTHKVQNTNFVRSNMPDAELAIRYGDREELKQNGIDVEKKPTVARRPVPFPQEGCKPPPGWTGR